MNQIDGQVSEDSPVIHISPMDFSDCYAVLGYSFLDYLASGCNVSVKEMAQVFDDGRLVPFHSRLYKESRLRRLKKLLDLVEKPE